MHRKDACKFSPFKAHQLRSLALFDEILVRDDYRNLDSYSFLVLIKACTRLKGVEKGLRIHAEVARLGLLDVDVYLGSALLGMYFKFGLPAKAQQLFNGLHVRDVVCWTALMAGLTDCNCGKEALYSFRRMHLESISPDGVSFLYGLKACSIVQAADIGSGLHAQIVSLSLLESYPRIGTTLVDMYSKCGFVIKSQKVFDKLLHRDCISWNALIAGYVEQGRHEKAINCFEQMKLEGVSPDDVTFAYVLSACGSIEAIELGEEIHAEIAGRGLQTSNFVGNSLIGFYARCGLLTSAKELLSLSSYQDVVSWTSLIAGYADHGYGEEALKCLKQMQTAGVPPNKATYICCFKGCGVSNLGQEAQHLHEEVERRGLSADDSMVGNAIVDMYSKCGMLNLAQQVFDKLALRDVVSWTTLISGCVELGLCDEALERFEGMMLDGVFPNAFTYVCALKACRGLGATVMGTELHAELKRRGEIQNNPFVGTMLVDMYAKCGSLDLARQVFDSLHIKDVISWTTLMMRYVEDGKGEVAIDCIDQMHCEGLSPNPVTYVCSLKAYSSTGAIDKVAKLQEELQEEGLWELEPVLQTTLVDAYAKCGKLPIAQAVFDNLHSLDIVPCPAPSSQYHEHGRSGMVLDCGRQRN